VAVALTTRRAQGARRPRTGGRAAAPASLAAAALALAACRASAPPPPAPPHPSVVRQAAAPSLARIDLAIHRYAGDRAGRLPGSLDALVLEGPPSGGRYLTDVPSDPWGRPYSYAVTDPRAGAYDLRSYGPDSLPGTSDDVTGRNRPVPVGTSESP
jgi:hypothetical protein